jgi:hypothetical protein
MLQQCLTTTMTMKMAALLNQSGEHHAAEGIPTQNPLPATEQEKEGRNKSSTCDSPSFKVYYLIAAQRVFESAGKCFKELQEVLHNEVLKLPYCTFLSASAERIVSLCEEIENISSHHNICMHLVIS